MEEKKAVALRYLPRRDRAPRLIAKGRGRLAQRIIEEGAKAGVPHYRHPQLVDGLFPLSLEGTIPPEFYRLVAEILVFVHGLDARYRGSRD
ncbi:MAG: EscU/YscU/HrcU family type III secretion system export apparatus switch protein [Limnochordia bacterium]|jgi:flagellar biosynthesis protein